MPAIISIFANTTKLRPGIGPQPVQRFPIRLFLYRPGEAQPSLIRAESTNAQGMVRFRVGDGNFLIAGGHTSEVTSSLKIPFLPDRELTYCFQISCDPVTFVGTGIRATKDA